jgi:hypothetical protein
VQTAISALQSVLQEDFKATEIEVGCLPFIHSAASDTRPLILNDRKQKDTGIKYTARADIKKEKERNFSVICLL